MFPLWCEYRLQYKCEAYFESKDVLYICVDAVRVWVMFRKNGYISQIQYMSKVLFHPKIKKTNLAFVLGCYFSAN